MTQYSSTGHILEMANHDYEDYLIQEEVENQLFQILHSEQDIEEMEKEKEARIEKNFLDFKKLLFVNIETLDYNDDISKIIDWSKSIIIDNNPKWKSRTTQRERERMVMFLILNNVENIPTQSVAKF